MGTARERPWCRLRGWNTLQVLRGPAPFDSKLNRGVAQTTTQIMIGAKFVSHPNLQVVLDLCLISEKVTNQQGATLS